MSPVRGIGGVFFKSKDPKKLQKWYEENLGLKPDDEGYIYFKWSDLEAPGYTLWGPFPEDTKYFDPSGADSMINFVVSDIEQFFAELRAKGVTVDERGIEETPEGKFAWIIDPEGNKIELWEPHDSR
ncbi:MAG: VOC family protein [Candidatus Thorarchaeota archaeon]|nr:MAG: VOC family protein [Candidatus Thorarchaeota archaeon]